ncbi:ADP-ribosyltransferase [Nocardia pseudovaccinii]|uniref:ADP-ribosyltransferase n=1 Tax=Nocardia pseudovaccinii TaxID=189540 RepID=UPI0007A388CF|nr:ADP-ribosyltransferase [Nocardia pseudovaccinii]
MTVLDVDTSVYNEAGNRLQVLATDWFNAANGLLPALDQCGNMTGTYTEAKKWAESYDTRAEAVLKMSTDLATATHHYGALLLEMGYNHALAEYTAAGLTGTAPSKPYTGPPAYGCRVPLPSAGGPGNGLLDGGVKLVEAIGITVPDGNVELLDRAATTWAAIAAAGPVQAMAAQLDTVAAQFEQITSPDASYIDEDIRALKAAAEATIATFKELSASTRDHHDGLVELRAKMVELLKQLGEELLKELAISAAIAVASSVVTFGIGAAVASARVVAIAAKIGRPIRILIEAFKTDRNIAKGVHVEQEIAKHQTEIRRIEELKAEPKKPIELPKNEHPEGVPKLDLDRVDKDAITSYTGSSGDINGALRSGKPLTPEQQAQVDQLNASLDKLPNYEGTVTRRTDMSAADLAKYQEGRTVTEDAFTSSSATPAAAKDRPIEFQIVSENGKYIGHYSSVPEEQEVLFKSGTEFQVLKRYEEGGRTIIQMVEK